MNYFFYNTDDVDKNWNLTGHKRRIHILIREGFAATGGPRKFGEQLGQLMTGDTLLMYENNVGVIAIGTVRENWDGERYRPPRYYPDPAPSDNEYRIGVDWGRNLSRDLLDKPISLEELRRRFGSPKFTPRGRHSAVLKIDKHRAAIERLVEELRLPAPPTCESIDLSVPDRIETKIYRILRDTELARRVKRMHNHKCQIQNCEYAMILPNGSPYAEAHHIQPLGGVHKGCDDMSNIMCVCPNHHAELDYGVIRIDLAKLRHAEGHSIDAKFVEYHNKKIFNH